MTDAPDAEEEAAADPAAEVEPDVADPPTRPRRRLRRRIVVGALGLLLLLILYVAGTFVQVWQASRHDGSRPAQAIIVLGAAQYNGRPSKTLQNRLDHALALYRRHLAPLIVVTGGRRSGDRYTEATVGYDVLRRAGVPDSAIRKEVQGRTTYESLASARRFLGKEGLHDVILVSSPATAERLAGIADDLGWRAAISPSTGKATFDQLARETMAVSVGRIIGYRRLERFDH